MAKKIGRVLSRYYKRDFGKRVRLLPKKLEFLSNIPFYAITECVLPDTGQHQIRVEVLPGSMKKLAKSYVREKAIIKENESLVIEIEEANTRILELEDYVAKQEHNINILLNKDSDTSPVPRSDIKSSLQIANEKGVDFQSRPLQGGLPSLGKKR